MNQRFKTYHIKNRVIAVVGIACMAAAVNLIYEPMKLVTGGVTGIGIIVKELTGNVADGGIPLWITNLICNIPLFLAAYRIYGRHFLAKELLDAVLFTIFLAIIPTGIFAIQDILLGVIFGGVIMGLGLGMVFAAGTTTGGMDLLAVLLKSKVKLWSEAQITAGLDGVIILAGAFVFGLDYALYALITIFIVMRVSDGILNGLKFSKMAYIISERSEEIAEYLMKDMKRGVTGIETIGMHTGHRQKTLLCVVSKRQIARLKEKTTALDPNAFLIITDASEILGEGFSYIGHNTR